MHMNCVFVRIETLIGQKESLTHLYVLNRSRPIRTRRGYDDVDLDGDVVPVLPLCECHQDDAKDGSWRAVQVQPPADQDISPEPVWSKSRERGSWQRQHQQRAETCLHRPVSWMLWYIFQHCRTLYYFFTSGMMGSGANFTSIARQLNKKTGE